MPQDLLQFLHVGKARLEKIGNNPFASWKVFRIADDWHPFRSRVFASPNNLNRLGIDLNNRKAVSEQGALDCVDRFFRRQPRNIEQDLALDEVILNHPKMRERRVLLKNITNINYRIAR